MPGIIVKTQSCLQLIIIQRLEQCVHIIERLAKHALLYLLALDIQPVQFSCDVLGHAV